MSRVATYTAEENSPPGGEYEFPSPVFAPTSASYYTTATPALPTHTGTTENCGKYYDTRPGDTCNVIVLLEYVLAPTTTRCECFVGVKWLNELVVV